MGKTLASFWEKHRRSFIIPVSGLATLLAIFTIRTTLQSERSVLPKKTVLEVEALARDQAPRTEAALEAISSEVKSIPKDTPDAVRLEVSANLSAMGAKIDRIVGAEGEAKARVAARLVELIDQRAPMLRNDLGVLLARMGEKGDWDTRFPDLRSLWQGRTSGSTSIPGFCFTPRSMFGFLHVLPPVPLEGIESLDTELQNLAQRSASGISELKGDVLREFAEHENDGTKGNERELRKFADQVLHELARIEADILDELGELSKHFKMTLPQVLAAFAGKAGGTSGGADLGTIETALQGKLTGDTNTDARAALTNAGRGASQVRSLLEALEADLSLRQLEKIIALARDFTQDLQGLVRAANERLDRIDRDRATGKPESSVEKELGKAADRLVKNMNAIEAEIQKGEIRIAGGAASPLLPAVQDEFRNQTRLLAPRLERMLSSLVDRLLGELGQVTTPAVQGKITNAILALRGLDRNFDTTPIGLVFTAPAPNTVTNVIPSIAFTMSDSGSGPNPSSRQLLAINAGPVAPGTTDLTASTALVLNDQVNGIVEVAAANLLPTAIQDGFITLQASGTDFANNPTTVATDPFVLDRVPPVIAMTSPTDGATFPTTTVPLNATLTDAVTGIAVNSINVTLNGTDITSAITQGLGPLNSLGAPTAVQLTGTLSALPGSNQLNFIATDLASNSLSQTITFTVSAGGGGGGLPPISEITLSIVSGNSQTGTIGRAPKDDLVVAVNSSAGPLAGVSLLFNPTQGGGDTNGPAPLTDSSGQTRVKFRLGPDASNTVHVEIWGFPEGPSVDFNLQGSPPTVSADNPNGSEMPGSAIQHTILVTVMGADGQPLKQESVVPIVGSNGQAVSNPASFGQFHPRIGTTNEAGQIRFAFEIAANAAPNSSIPIEFTMPDFKAGDGKAIRGGDGTVNVLDPTGKDTGITGVGQGQIVIPNHVTPKELEAFTTIPITPTLVVPIQFTILEGGGTLLPARGDFTPVFIDSQGNVIVASVQPPENTETCTVRYQKGNENVPSLITVGAHPTDTFVVSVPQAFLIDGSGKTIQRPHDADLSNVGAADTVKLRVLTEIGADVNPVKFRSQDALFQDITDGAGIGLITLDVPGLSGSVSPEPDRYSQFESDTLLFTSEILPPAQTPSGVTLFQVFGGGGFKYVPTTGGSLDIPTPFTTIEGIFPGTIFVGETIGDPTASITGRAQRLDPLAGRNLQVLLNGSPSLQLSSDAGGSVETDITLGAPVTLLQLKDLDTGAVSAALPLGQLQTIAGTVGDPVPPPQVAAQETVESIELILNKSTKVGMPALAKYRGNLTADKWNLITVADLQANKEAGKNMVGLTTFVEETKKFNVLVGQQGNVVADALTLGHELRHVQDDLQTIDDLKKLVATTAEWPAGKGLVDVPRMILWAGVVQFVDAYGSAVPQDTADKNFNRFRAENLEVGPFQQELAILGELAALKDPNIPTNGLMTDLVGKSGEALIQAIETRYLANSQARRPGIVKVAESVLESVNKVLDVKPPQGKTLREFMTDSGLLGDKITAANKLLLLKAAFSPTLIPPK